MQRKDIGQVLETIVSVAADKANLIDANRRSRVDCTRRVTSVTWTTFEVSVHTYALSTPVVPLDDEHRSRRVKIDLIRESIWRCSNTRRAASCHVERRWQRCELAPPLSMNNIRIRSQRMLNILCVIPSTYCPVILTDLESVNAEQNPSAVAQLLRDASRSFNRSAASRRNLPQAHYNDQQNGATRLPPYRAASVSPAIRKSERW